jgi:hypothetical protein
MLSENIIQQSQTVQGLGSMVAVDGGNNVLNIGLGTQCFVVSVLYSLRQNYDVRISRERLAFEEEEATALIYGVRNAMEVRDIIEGKIYFLNIDSYNTSVNVFILGTLYKRFRSCALNLYKSRQKYANAIVYVDEANRFIPQSPKDEKQKELQEKLIDGIKTTRQYGLAWWLADQRPSAISKDAFTQMGTFFFGKGMTAVADQTNMESVLGKDGCNVYSYVATMGGSPFVASGQFIGVGSSESVAVPMQFFNSWQTLATQNNETLDAHIQAETTNNNS